MSLPMNRRSMAITSDGLTINPSKVDIDAFDRMVEAKLSLTAIAQALAISIGYASDLRRRRARRLQGHPEPDAPLAAAVYRCERCGGRSAEKAGHPSCPAREPIANGLAAMRSLPAHQAGWR
jgi:hypothetical protein